VLSQERWEEPRDNGQVGWASPTGGAAIDTAAGGAAVIDATAVSTDRDQHGGGWTAHAAGQAGTPSVVTGKRMTLGGTLTATGVLFVCLLATAAIGWAQVKAVDLTPLPTALVPDPEPVYNVDYPGWVFFPMIGALVAGLVLCFKPRLGMILAPLYALGYGFALGAISHMYDLQFNGIVIQAVGATFGVFFMMFFLYATRIIKVTPRLVAGIVAATFGVFALYMVAFVMSIFGVDLSFYNDPTPIGIGITVLIAGIAAFNLLIDFAFIESAIKSGEPKYMEWYGAFGLTVTLIWLYLTLLRLLSLLRQ
jgi:uncharacterized YccA/Bax inhibitor family protein